MKKYIPTVLFSIFIVGFFLLDVLTPTKEFSDLENRYLETYSPPTVKSLLDNSFTSKFDTFVNDQFIFRPQWITLKSVGESVMLKTENNGIVYGKEHYMFDKNSVIDNDRLLSNLLHIREFSESYPDKNVYFSLVPSSYSVLSDYLPYGLKLEPQIESIRNIYNGQLDDCGIKTVDVSPLLLEHKNEYIYYRTDHHWTTEGAYLAYKTYIESVGKTPVTLEQLDRNTVEGFYGTYYSKAKAFDTVPDEINYYDLPAVSVRIDGEIKKGLYDLEQFQKRDKYAGFLYNNNGLSVLKSDKKNQDNSRILLIKDSYGNCLAPFFLENYSEVYVVDLRYIEGIDQLMSDIDFDDIYIIYSFANFSTDSNVIKMLPEE